MLVQFAKYEGLGNDFIVIEPRELAATELTQAQVIAWCDRHRGIGADGILLVDWTETEPRTLRMRVVNADGSRPEMCGNGLRCVALHAVRRGHAKAGSTFTVATDSGPHSCRVSSAERTSQVEVSMRPASLVPSEIPVRLAHPAREVLDEAFEVGETSVRLSCVSMGNPHAVTFDELGPSARAKLGPLLEKDARFPQAANIGFARVLEPNRIELAVWERGVGFTEACGTGACACAVAAIETGRADRQHPLEILLPGGALQIRVGAPGERISMTGPARHVFDGSIEP
jgi:diaminopimelate epimerase